MEGPNNKPNLPLNIDIEDFLPISKSTSLNKEKEEESKSQSTTEKNDNSPFSLPFPSIQNIPESEDPSIISDIFSDARVFKNLIFSRMKSLTELTKIWNDGKNKKSCFEYLCQSNDFGIIKDFLNFAFIKTELKYMDMRSKEIVVIFPVIIEMCKSKYEDYFKTGILSATKILEYLGELIIATKQSQYRNPMMIDLNKEEKIKVYDEIISYFSQLIELENVGIFLEKEKYQKIKGVNLNEFIIEVALFIERCQNDNDNG